MTENYPFMSMEEPCEEAIKWVIHEMSAAGLFVIRTFDLKVARTLQTDCYCPHHGTEQCDCQLIVLLIYGSNQEPSSLVAHGYEGKTWFSLVDTPQQPANPDLTGFILQTLTHPSSPGFNPSRISHAT